MRMDEHARAWSHEFVAGLLTEYGTPAEQRNALHWEIVSHLHEAAEARARQIGAASVTLLDVQAVVDRMGGRPGVAGVFLQVRMANLPRARFLKRAGAYVLDVYMVGIAWWGALGMTNGIFPFLNLDRWFMDGPAWILFCGLLFGYFAVMEFQYGWTVGKKILRLRTHMVDGRAVTKDAAMIRSIAKALPPLVLVDALFIFDKDRQRGSDRLAGTIVIDPKATPTSQQTWRVQPEPTGFAQRVTEHRYGGQPPGSN